MANAVFEKPRREPAGWFTVLKEVVRQETMKMRTVIPAKVIEVNYSNSTVLVQPLIKTWWEKFRSEVAPWPLEGIPIVFPSAKRGMARITMPLKKGDVGLVLFSDRHTDLYLATEGTESTDSGSMAAMGIDGFMNVIGFIPEIFTESNNKGFSKETLQLNHDKAFIDMYESGKIILKNDISTFQMSESGEINTTNGSGTVNIAPDGTIKSSNGSVSCELSSSGSAKITNGGGFIELMANGSISLNGLIILPDGTVPNLIVNSSLTKGGIEVPNMDHEHGAGTYEAGKTKVTGLSGKTSE